jgi:hypothetical protein
MAEQFPVKEVLRSLSPRASMWPWPWPSVFRGTRLGAS